MTNIHASPPRRPILVRSIFAAAVSFLIVLVVPAGIASAHTSFEESSPANGETLAEPVSTIVLQFSGESEYGDDGFSVLTPDGQVRTPTTVSSTDQKTFELTFDPPLTGGEVGVRWAVNAPDAHPIDGVFSFVVTAPATVVDAPQTGAAGGDELPSSGATENISDTAAMTEGAPAAASTESTSLDEFLAQRPARGGEGTARWGRLIGFAALALIVGGGAFAATTFRGRRAEIDRAIAILRILGVALAIGALLEYVGAARIAEASILGYWSAQPGMAALLRVAGGLAVAAGLTAVTVRVRVPRPVHSLSAAANPTMEYELEERDRFWSDDHVHWRHDLPADDIGNAAPSETARAIDPLLDHHRLPVASEAGSASSQRSITISTSPPPRQPRVENRGEPTAQAAPTEPTELPAIRQWVPDRASSAAYIGVAVAVVSFWFDGHTVSKGIRPLHAAVNSIHVVAGSVWLGGVVAMAVVLWSRHRAGVAPRALEMIVRFSGIATIALGAVIAAGGIMAFLVLDSVGELFSTQWGQVLLLKSGAAGLAMLGGAYNHFRLLPALEADPDNPELVGHLRSAVTSEAIMLGFVIVVTASLVAAAS